MFPSTAGPLESYNSLQDHHLLGYYSNPKKLRHLRKMGLITRDGEIVDDATFRLNAARKEQAQNTKTLLAASIVRKAAELETQRCIELKRKLEFLSKMERVEKIKMARQHPPGLEEDFNPYPPGTVPPPQSGGSQRPVPLLYPPRPQSSMDILHQRLGITPSEVDLYHTVTKPKIISGAHAHSPYSLTGPVIQPTPPSVPRPLSKTAPPSHGAKGRQGATPKRRSTIRRKPIASSDTNKLQDQPEVTLYYTGPSLRLEGVPELTALTDVVILQQHCGGNTVCVFKAKIKAQDHISFTSRRHRDCPFGISIYVDGMIDTRVSVCCEYRHKVGKNLGCKNGHFKLVKVSGGKPCLQCQLSEGGRGGGRLSQNKKASTTMEKRGEIASYSSSVALEILKDLQSPPLEEATSSTSKEPQQGSRDEQQIRQIGMADKSTQVSAKDQENGRHGEAGQDPTFTSAEQQYEEEFASGDDSFEHDDKGSDKDSDSEVDSDSTAHSDSDGDKYSHSDSDKGGHGGDKHSHSSDDEGSHSDGDIGGHSDGDKGGHSDGDKGGHSDGDKGCHSDGDKGGHSDGDKGGHSDGVNALGTSLSDSLPTGGEHEPVEKNNSCNHEVEDEGSEGVAIKESDVVVETAREAEEAAGDRSGKEEEKEGEVEEEVGEEGKEEKANHIGSGGNDSGREGNSDDQIAELVSQPAHGEEGDFPVPVSREDEPGRNTVQGELEGGATSNSDPNNAGEKGEADREESGASSNTNGAESKPIEELPKTVRDEQPSGNDGTRSPPQPLNLHLAHSSSISSISSLSSSEYSLASDNDN